ncbi:MAG: efflux RND transporter periplasmic adaptor subunit [Planctomycetota bacterium]|jgi:Cu(I)/Ag(I) efflux system membrane fusion protein
MSEQARPTQANEARASVEQPPRRIGKWWLILSGACAASLILGAVVGGALSRRRDAAAEPEQAPKPAGPATVTMWTCSMHPEFELPDPGLCPICDMDLIPMEGDSDDHPRRLTMSENAAALADVQTAPVRRQYVTKQVRMVGKVDYDETRLANITAWVSGRLDRLFVDFTGVPVRKGDHLVSIYSEELIKAQRELLVAWQTHNRPAAERDRRLDDAALAERKLRRLGLTEAQIAEIKRRGTPSDHLTIFAEIGGIVIQKHAKVGDYVDAGTKVYTIADLSQVWVYLDAYESDVPWLRSWQEVEFITETGEIFKGHIVFIDPVLNEKTRTVRVRVNVPNPDLRLKPGMFVRATARSRLAAGGRVLDSFLAGKWMCPMHPEIVKEPVSQSDGTTKVEPCDVCGMDLVKAEHLGHVAADTDGPPLVIPALAPLITGRRAIVYVKLPDRDEPTFEGREVLLGQRAGDYYVVRHGLDEGEEVVTRGNFKIDSELQLRPGKLSMMTPASGLAAVETEGGAEEDAAEEKVVSRAFRAGLVPLFGAYLAAAEALARDDLAAAQAAVRGVPELAAAVDAAALYEEHRNRWDRILDPLLVAAYETADARDRTAFRLRFRHLSRAMIAAAESFGNPLPGPLKRMHCPRAFNNEGADWLQAAGEVRNPYFGPEMLGCGRVEATLAPSPPVAVPDPFRRELAPLYRAYLNLQVALADDRLHDSRAAWQAMRGALGGVRADALDARAARLWKTQSASMADALAADPAAADVDRLRASFETVALGMLAVADQFGHAGPEPLFEAYCPMAFKNKGAPWLQAGDTVDNPYFGHRMKRCGEIERRFAGVVSGGAPAVKEESQ